MERKRGEASAASDAGIGRESAHGRADPLPLRKKPKSGVVPGALPCAGVADGLPVRVAECDKHDATL
jgi:hypothetical protein